MAARAAHEAPKPFSLPEAVSLIDEDIHPELIPVPTAGKQILIPRSPMTPDYGFLWVEGLP